MAILSRWDPFNELQRLTDQILRTGAPEGAARTFAPAVDIFEDENAVYVKAEVPGVSAKDVHIDVENNVLTIHGERKLEREDKREGYHRIETMYGTFTRSFSLPESADAEHVEADLNDGMLTVKIPKKPEVSPKRIEVKAKSPEKVAAGEPGKEAQKK
jgi:HSP20 family protein